METPSIATADAAAALQTDVRAGKYLTFQVGREEFAIRVLKVREIMGMMDITVVPHTPAYVKGVINLRGKVIPVIDLRLKFGVQNAEDTQRTCIIVVEAKAESGQVLMGTVVDSVSEVVNLVAADIEDTPDFGEGVATPYILGIAKTKKKVYILLDIDEVLTHQELHGLQALQQ